MGKQAGKLRELLDRGEHFIAADVYSALTARIVEHVGFKACYLGGHACSAFHYAIPDNGIFSPVEQLEQATRIQDAIDIPLIADADTLGETVAEAFHYARRYVRAGIAGIHIEDEVNPKHSTYVNGLISIEDMQARIEACVKAREGSDLVIVARCDELYPNAYRGGGNGSLEEALKRGKAYVEAGADSLVFPIAAPEAAAQLAKEIPVPFCVLGQDFPGSVCNLFTGWGAMAAAKLHLKLARELYETGTIKFEGFLEKPGQFEGKEKLIEQDFYDALIADWARKTGRPVR